MLGSWCLHMAQEHLQGCSQSPLDADCSPWLCAPQLRELWGALQGVDVPQLGAVRLCPGRDVEMEVCDEVGERSPLCCPQASLRRGKKVRWS